MIARVHPSRPTRPAALRRRPGRRGFVLLAVLVVVGIAILITTGLIFASDAELSALRGAADATQARLLLWSGAQAVTARLESQRDRILDGELPEVQAQYEIYEADGRLGVVRLLPIGPGDERLVPEAGKLDLNAVTAEMLEATGWVDASLAEAIVSWRDGRGTVRSVAELLEVEGVTPELLYGPLEGLTPIDDASFEEADLGVRVAARLDDVAARGLADLLTAHGFEPAVQRSGKLRINLNVPWSDELGRRLDERFGEGAGDLVKSVSAQMAFDAERRIVEALVAYDTPLEQWPEIIDALTTEAGEFHFGRLDLNRASLEALLGLGLDEAQAGRIVDERDALDHDERATVAWPVQRGIIEPEDFVELSGRVTSRSWTFAARLAAGEVDADDPEGPIDRPVVSDVIIDLSMPRARIAYLRDVTVLQTAAMLALNAPPSDEPDVDADLQPADTLEGADETGPDDETDPTTSVPDSGSDDALAMPVDDEILPAGDEPDPADPVDVKDDRADDELDPEAPDDGAAVGDDEAAPPPSRRRVGRWLGGD